MPQPYRGRSELIFAAPAFMERPGLGGRIAAISTLWSLVEDIWSVMLWMAVGMHQPGPGAALHQVSTGAGTQLSVLDEMVDAYIPPEFKADFAALMSLAKSCAAERNEVVHGLWFHDPKDANALMLAPRHVFLRRFTKLAEQAERRRSPIEKVVAASEAVGDQWMVYRGSDFDTISRRISAFAIDLDAFVHRLAAAKGYPTIDVWAPAD